MLKDRKDRKLQIGNRVRVEEDIPSPDGMLYKDTLVKLDEWNEDSNKIRVTDRVGKVWWLKPNQISVSFL